jgi:hypothetical protein
MTRPTRSGKGEFVGCSRSRRIATVLLLGLAAYACRPEPSVDAVRLEAGVRDGQRVVAVIPAMGVRINARVPPALELDNGAVVRLAAGRVLPDSSYFAEAPWGSLPGGVRLRGVLRVSYCRASEALCRTASIPVDLRE